MLARRLWFGVPLALVCSLANAQPADDLASNEKRAEESFRAVEQFSSQMEFYLGGERQRKLTRHPQSTLRWSNTLSNNLFGEVYVWVADGRPEVIAAVYRFYQPTLYQTSAELHSLALEPVVGVREGHEFWTPTEPGISLQSITDAPPVAHTGPQRLTQMRALARQFSADTTARNEPTAAEPLRLLPKPIYRYEPRRAGLLDGAIFAFVQGTNPDVLLILEARQFEGKPAWQYALVRMNSVALRAAYQRQPVWSVPQIAPPWENVRDPRKTYFVPILERGP